MQGHAREKQNVSIAYAYQFTISQQQQRRNEIDAIAIEQLLKFINLIRDSFSPRDVL